MNKIYQIDYCHPAEVSIIGKDKKGKRQTVYQNSRAEVVALVAATSCKTALEIFNINNVYDIKSIVEPGPLVISECYNVKIK